MHLTFLQAGLIDGRWYGRMFRNYASLFFKIIQRRFSMARKLVTHYAVFHNIGGTSDIAFYYQGGGADSVSGIPYAEANYIVDLLRNEKPMSYDHDKKRLSTFNSEPVGEGE
ncbi:hypothetical protein [Chlorobium limicola]|nr:hypothetical protein [Chlorobium limicola]